MQYVAVCCTVLQKSPLTLSSRSFCSASHCVSVRCIALQTVLVGSVWQWMLQCCVLQCVAVCCSVVQCGAVCCSVMQCVAVCRSAWQSVAKNHQWRFPPTPSNPRHKNFSKSSSLSNLLCKTTVKLAFEKFSTKDTQIC